jgi:hypothetical protein
MSGVPEASPRGRPRRRRIARPDHWLAAAAGVLTLAGLTLLLRPPTVSAVRVAPPRFALPATPAAIHASDPAARDVIVRANVFSATRTPPRTRYAPPDAAMPADAGALVDDPAEAVVEAVPVPQLYGTVVGAAGATALIAVDPGAAAAQLYRVGDRAGGWRVVRIGDRSAVLEGPGGRVTLRLRRSESVAPAAAPVAPPDSVSEPAAGEARR